MPRIKDLNPNEWHFLSVPKNETEACFCHEYAREVARKSDRIRNLLVKSRRGPQASKDNRREEMAARRKLSKIMTACFPQCLILTDDEFPNKPWQETAAADRAQIVQYLKDENRDLTGLLASGALSQRTLAELKMDDMSRVGDFRWLHEFLREEDFSQTEYGFFAVNWYYTDSEIQRAFNDWLLEERQKPKSLGEEGTVKQRSGRGGPWDGLNWLGALRQRKHYRKCELVNEGETKLKVPSFYGHFPDFRKAAKKAASLLDNLLEKTGRI